MDLGSIGDPKQFLQGVNFPADKQEVASGAESNGAPQGLVDQIKNAAKDRFNSPDEVLQVIGK